LNLPPSITAQPESQSVPQGSAATFNVVANGTAPLSYQWRFDGTNIASATTNSFTRNNVQTNDAGYYSVVVTNVAGVVTSSNAMLTVLVPPVILTQPESQSVKVGTNATFTVSATGSPPLNYQWRFGGTNIVGATTNTYTRSNIQIADAGDYSAVVTNVASLVTSSNAVLTVIPSKPLKFDLVGLLPEGRVRLVLSGDPGNYQVERGSNFVNWTTLTNIVITNETAEFVDETAVGQARRYYRAMLTP
jgi:hypothetical protein